MAPFKIAIAGSGIASLCLAHSLISKHPQWEVKIFEAGPELREEGAAIGLGSNAQEALQLMSPSLREALDEAGGTRMDPSVRIMIVNHHLVLPSLASADGTSPGHWTRLW